MLYKVLPSEVVQVYTSRAAGSSGCDWTSIHGPLHKAGNPISNLRQTTQGGWPPCCPASQPACGPPPCHPKDQQWWGPDPGIPGIESREFQRGAGGPGGRKPVWCPFFQHPGSYPGSKSTSHCNLEVFKNPAGRFYLAPYTMRSPDCGPDDHLLDTEL